MKGRLEGKVAVITGTSRGIGKALSRAFTGAGALVIGGSRSEGVDVTGEADVIALFDRAVEHGGPDIVITNAGILTPKKPLSEVTLSEWETSLAVNLTGVFLCIREAMRRMNERGGLIINVSSGVSSRAAPQWGPYAAGKWGVEGLTKLAAAEGEQHGIRVIAINPDRTRTAMRRLAYPDEDPSTVKSPDETARFFVAVASGEIPFTSGDTLTYEPVD